MAKEYHPQMHTAEHILNQTMVRMYNKKQLWLTWKRKNQNAIIILKEI